MKHPSTAAIALLAGCCAWAAAPGTDRGGPATDDRRPPPRPPAAAGFSTQVYDGPGWVRFGVSTYPLTRRDSPGLRGTQSAALVYDPARAWAGYDWLSSTYTDSAAAITAMATGQKTYRGAMNWSDMNTPVTPTIVELAHAAGKATGTITTVQFSHATPAGMSNAHQVSRDNYADIANQMLGGGVLDVIMGCGNPDFDDDGKPADMDAAFVGGSATWAQLKAGAHPGGWQLRQTVADFEALTVGRPIGRFLGVPQAHTTLQQARSTRDWNGNGKQEAADARVAPVHDPSRESFGDPPNRNVPSLALMTRAALNILGADRDGFFLHIEGGAVDWANHANQPGRLIEEQMAFNRAVEEVVTWVEANSNWNETLLLVTADHETGLLWGPKSDTVPFDPIRDGGEGCPPRLRFNSDEHTNSLAPVFARGAGSGLLATLADGVDPAAAAAWPSAWGWDGSYVDNTDIFTVMSTCGAKNVILMIADGAGFNAYNATSMWEGRWIPEPPEWWSLVAGLLEQWR